MQLLRRSRVMAAVAVAAVWFGLSGTCQASEASAFPSAQQYHLRLHHLHTGEDIDVVYRVGDTYLPAALDRLNYFLRDHRTQSESSYDPKEFDLLHSLMTRLGRPNGVIDIVCGYRTPWSNNFLRRDSASTGVAEHSQHMLAKAIDIRVPGVRTAKLRDAALSLHGGGVGYYPVNQFVHVDVGPVREWSFGRAHAHPQTAKVRGARVGRARSQGSAAGE
jgi:uncharacterized protein YcbK (DUF882 family)